MPLTSKAFEQSFLGSYGGLLVALGLTLFAFSTAIAWSYYGDRAVTYLVGTKWVLPYRCLYVLGFFLATIVDTSLIWLISAVTVALMTLPNLIGMFLMRKEVKQMTHDYWQKVSSSAIHRNGAAAGWGIRCLGSLNAESFSILLCRGSNHGNFEAHRSCSRPAGRSCGLHQFHHNQALRVKGIRMSSVLSSPNRQVVLVGCGSLQAAQFIDQAETLAARPSTPVLGQSFPPLSAACRDVRYQVNEFCMFGLCRELKDVFARSLRPSTAHAASKRRAGYAIGVNAQGTQTLEFAQCRRCQWSQWLWVPRRLHALADIQ